MMLYTCGKSIDKQSLTAPLKQFGAFRSLPSVPVVPHKAVAEVSRIGNV